MNASHPKTLQFYQQVYTSSSALLDKAHGDLGVVCETTGFPREIQADLDRLNAYQPLNTISEASLEKHPPAYVLKTRGPQNCWYTISRTVFAGADHTGRTNPLAHHFVIDLNGSQKTISLADQLHSLRAYFVSRWTDEPRRLDQPSEIPLVRRLGDGERFPSPVWRKFTSERSVTAILGFFAEHFTAVSTAAGRSVILVVPPTLGDEIRDLLSDLLAVLPPSNALEVSMRTHVLSPPGVSGQCRVMVTYPGTAYLGQEQRRQDDHRPIIMNLVDGELPNSLCKDYGVRIQATLNSGGTAGDLQKLVDLRSILGVVDDSDGTPFTDFELVQQRLASNSPLQDIHRTLLQWSSIGRAAPAGLKLMSSGLAKAIAGHFNARKCNSDWSVFTTLAFTNSVPQQSRKLATQAIDKCLAKALPAILEHPLMASQSGDKIKEWLRMRVDSRPEVITSLVQEALNKSSESSVPAIQKVLLDLQPRVTPDICESWGLLLHAQPASSSPIRRLIGRFVAQQIRDATIAPMELAKAISDIVGQCEESERRQILFDVLEASARSNQLAEFVEWFGQTFGVDQNSIAGNDISRHLKPVQTAIRNVTQVKPEPQLARQSPSPPVNDVFPWDLGNSGTRPSRPQTRSVSSEGEKVSSIMNICWWLALGSTLSILFTGGYLVLEFRWLSLPHLRFPTSNPNASEWVGLMAFPGAMLYYLIMLSLVKCNKDPKKLSESIWRLNSACVVLSLGVLLTLCRCFSWLIQ